MSIEDIALRFEGYTDTQITQMRGTLEDFEHLLIVIEGELPRIKRTLIGLQMALAVVQKRI